MPKTVSYQKSSGGGFFKPEAGGYPAIIVGVIELGTEEKDYKKDGNTKMVEELALVYEIEASQEVYDSEKQELTGEHEDKVGTISQNYTVVVSDNSKLGKTIKSIYDVDSMDKIKNFSLDKLLGLKCYINIELKGKDNNFPVVSSVSALNKKMESALHKNETEPFYFGMEDPNDFCVEPQDLSKFVPKWEVERIEASPEYRTLMKNMGVEIPETLEEQEENMKKEAEERKAQTPATAKDAEDVFNQEKTQEAPKEEAKTEAPAEEKKENPFGE